VIFESSWRGWCSSKFGGVYEVGYGRILGGVERSFIVIPNLSGRWLQG
jgi:hypothetical protein